MKVVDEIEEIQAAIENLTAIKAIGWPCANWSYEAARHIARNCEISCDCDMADHPGWDRYETGNAIYILSQTIDAQLAILRDAGGALRAGAYLWDYALNLARAINGKPAGETK